MVTNMKLSKTAQPLLAKNKGDREIRRMIKEGGIPGSEKTFNEILRRASQPLSKQQKESLKG